MPSDDLKKRIEALNRKPLKNVPQEQSDESPEIRALRRKLRKQVGAKAAPVPASQIPPPDADPTAAGSSAIPAQITYSRSVTERPSPRPRPPMCDAGRPVSLEQVVEGVLASAEHGPGYYLIEKPAHLLEQTATDLHRRFVQLTGHPDGAAVERLARVCEAERIDPEEVLFLDLETAGLGMAALFLVGTMECTRDGFRFRQYFARDYSEEASVLSAYSERAANVRLVVTFNGKTFDMPFIRNRSIATGVRVCEPPAHLDLLHEARRLYKGELPNCRLQTLEHCICGRDRDDDIPGSEIPAAYHEFVRTGNANKIGLILMHNLYDLLTMADLMHRMWCRE